MIGILTDLADYLQNLDCTFKISCDMAGTAIFVYHFEKMTSFLCLKVLNITVLCKVVVLTKFARLLNSQVILLISNKRF